jgi:hypothetical protein
MFDVREFVGRSLLIVDFGLNMTGGAGFEFCGVVQRHKFLLYTCELEVYSTGGQAAGGISQLLRSFFQNDP